MITQSDARTGSSLMGCGAFLVASAIAAGAFGAHALKGALTPPDLEVFQTAAHYHLLQGIAVTFWGFVGSSCAFCSRRRAIGRATVMLIVSTVIFSATLYALVLLNVRWLGAITPIGGAGMIVSWTWLGWLSFTGIHRSQDPK